MKTNQQMLVTIGEYTQPIEHKTMLGHLNTLWEYGNSLRIRKGLQPKNLENWLRQQDTLELVIAVERRCFNYPDSSTLKSDDSNHVDSTALDTGKSNLLESTTLKPVESTTLKIEPTNNPSRFKLSGKPKCLIQKRGRYGGTWAHLYILLDAAAHLDADFKVEVYETFVTNRILQWRDDSGEEFIALNASIDAYLPGRDGKDNRGIFIQMARAIKSRVKPDGEAWNTASFHQLEDRTKIEQSLCKLLSLGLVRDYDHLKELVEKV